MMPVPRCLFSFRGQIVKRFMAGVRESWLGCQAQQVLPRPISLQDTAVLAHPLTPTFSRRERGKAADIGRIGIVAASLLLAAAGPPPVDPDWPCVQRLVPVLTAGTIWAGHDAAGDWRADPAVAATVAAAAPRIRPLPQAVATLDAYASTLPADGRPAALSLLFAGLVDETNRQRTEVIERLRGIARRQRSLTEITGRVTAELRALPPDASAAVRDEAVQRRAYLVREYEEIERTIRYACEVPGALEARLGSFAQALQRDLNK